jgi:hypothetical protein
MEFGYLTDSAYLAVIGADRVHEDYLGWFFAFGFFMIAMCFGAIVRWYFVPYAISKTGRQLISGSALIIATYLCWYWLITDHGFLELILLKASPEQLVGTWNPRITMPVWIIGYVMFPGGLLLYIFGVLNGRDKQAL